MWIVQLFKNDKKALQWQRLPFQSSFSAFIWQREIGGGNIQKFQFFVGQLWGRRSIKVPRCSYAFPKVEEIWQLNIFLYDIDFVDGELVGELAQRNFQKFDVTPITFVTSATWTPSFCCSTRGTTFQRLEIWSEIWLHVACESSRFNQRMLTR